MSDDDKRMENHRSIPSMHLTNSPDVPLSVQNACPSWGNRLY
jgi:hypothetical protein